MGVKCSLVPCLILFYYLEYCSESPLWILLLTQMFYIRLASGNFELCIFSGETPEYSYCVIG